MKVRYSKTKDIPIDQLIELYKSVGWEKQNARASKDSILSQKYKNSDIVISAWIGKELVGVVRAITDRVLSGVIFSLAVRKQYQRKGIGKELVKRCMNNYPEINWYLASINKKTDKFYNKIGLNKDNNRWFCKEKIR